MAPKHGLSDDQVKEFKELFDSLDQDGGGVIDVDELAELFASLGVKVSKDKVKEMFAEVDEDGSGEIDFEEFLVLVAKQVAEDGKKDPYTEAMKAFAMFDTDGSGTIDASELGSALKAMGHNVSEAEIKEMLLQADDDGTGEIEFEEFCTLMGIEVPNKANKADNAAVAGEVSTKKSATQKPQKPSQKASKPSTKEAAKKQTHDPNEVIDPHSVLSEDEIKDMKEIFELFDEDRSGHIDMEELSKMMDGMGRSLSQAELKAMVAEVDVDGSGEIDFEEFLTIMARDKKNSDPMDEAMKIFNMFDKDGSGTCLISHSKVSCLISQK
jgi:Ca2+-binding EF-hand superfamily protein